MSTDADTDPGHDLLVGILSEQTLAIEAVTDAVGQMARSSEAVARQFVEESGKRQAWEQASADARAKNDKTLTLILSEVRRIGKRVTAVEEENDALKALALLHEANKRNGNGSGNGHG